MNTWESEALERLNRVEVSMQDLLQASALVHELPEDQRDFEGRALVMLRLFPGQPDKCQVVEYRLQAMSSLLSERALPGWATPPSEDGAVLISEPVFQAAATQPIVMSNGRPAFAADAFVKRVLELAPAEGSA